MLLGATGGTARHSLALEHALRPMFTYLHAVVAPTSVFAATEDWAGGGTRPCTGASTGPAASSPTWSAGGSRRWSPTRSR